MRPIVSISVFVVLLVACAAPLPPATPSPMPVTPTPAPTAMVWEEYHSDDLVFSLQLPRGWTASRTQGAEGEVLRANGGEQGTLLINIDEPQEDVPFEQYVRDSFRSLLEENPDAVQPANLPGGRAVRVTSPRPDGGMSVIYVFAPRGHAKWLSFTWDGDNPNPLWQQIAERFNAYSPRPIIPFVTPSP